MSDIIQLAYIPDHKRRLKDRMLSQFKGSPNIQAYIYALADCFQDIEDSAFDVINSRLLDGGSNSELVLYWGPIVGEEKGALTDSEFRSVVKAKMSAIMCDGSDGSILRTWISLQSPGEGWSVLHYPAGYMLYTVQATPLSTAMRERMREMLAGVKPAGVQYDIVEGAQSFFGYAGNESPFIAGYGTGKYGGIA